MSPLNPDQKPVFCSDPGGRPIDGYPDGWLQEIFDTIGTITGYVPAQPITAEDIKRCTRVFTFDTPR